MERVFSDAKLLELVELIYEAASDPSAWSRFMAAFHEVLPQTMVTKLISIEGTSIDQFSSWAGISDESAAAYFAHYQYINSFNPLIAKLPVGRVFRRPEVATTEWVKTQAIYHEWLVPSGGYLYGACLTVARDERRLARITVDLPECDEHLEPVVAEILNRLRGHIRRAFDLNDALYGHVLTQKTLIGVLERISGAAFIVTAESRVFALNAEAEALARRGIGLRITAANRLSFTQSDQERLYREALSLSMNPALDQAAQPFMVATGDAAQVVATVMPLSGATDASLAAAATTPLALVTLHRPAPSQNLKTLLKTRYRLTQAEAELASLIGSGVSVADASAQLQISKATARNQLAAVMGKLGVHRQAEVVALLSQLTPGLQ